MSDCLQGKPRPVSHKLAATTLPAASGGSADHDRPITRNHTGQHTYDQNKRQQHPCQTGWETSATRRPCAGPNTTNWGNTLHHPYPQTLS
eukprot:scaffold63923_cov38-Tisochrysis_lutea.AAC.1